MKVGRVAALALIACALSLFPGCSKRKPQGWPPSMRTAAPESAASLVHDAKGEVVLFVLYASWCSGCRQELPTVDRLALKYEGRGLRVVALALDEDPQDYAELLDEQKLHFDLVRVAPLDQSKLAQSVSQLGGRFAQSIPYTAVFDRSGKLARELTGDAAPGEIEAAVTALL